MGSTRRPFLILVFVLTFAAAASAALAQPASRASAKDGYEITVLPGRPDGVYEPNRHLTWRIRVSRHGEPVTAGFTIISLTVNDVGGESPILKVPLVGGEANVVIGHFRSGECVVLRAAHSWGENETIRAESGAVVDPNKIGLSMPCPNDFDAFWAAQKRRLAEVPMNPKLTPVEGNAVPAHVEAFDVQVDCAGGAPVSAYMARPKGAKPKSLPIYLTVHGAGVRSSSLMGPVGQAGQGRLAMDLNAHGIPNGKPAEFYANLQSGDLRDYPRRGMDSRETCYFLGMYLRLARALEFLCSQPEWDGRHLFVAGSSQGGAQAVVAAGLDERVTIISASLPALCDLTGMQVGRSAGWPLQRAALDANQVQAVRYFDVCNFAARAKATAVVRVGLIDHTCPPAGVFAMCNQLKGKKYVFTYPDAGHSYSPPDTYRPASDKFRELIAEALKPLP